MSIKKSVQLSLNPRNPRSDFILYSMHPIGGRSFTRRLLMFPACKAFELSKHFPGKNHGSG
jgi:hypothetical protein